MLELDISPYHSKCPLIDDLVVVSTMKDLLDQGAWSLAPHRSETPYCKVCYFEIINSVGAKECYSTCKENLYWRAAYWHYLKKDAKRMESKKKYIYNSGLNRVLCYNWGFNPALIFSVPMFTYSFELSWVVLSLYTKDSLFNTKDSCWFFFFFFFKWESC